MTEDIREAIAAAETYLTAHPDETRYTDTAATATLHEGLRFVVTGPNDESVVTDMPPAVGGAGEHPSPGWLFRAALASCDASLIAMRAAQQGVVLTSLEVVVDSESDDRGILGMDSSVPAGPLAVRTRIRLSADGVDEDRLREIVGWGIEHCPVCDATKRAVEVTTDVEVET